MSASPQERLTVKPGPLAGVFQAIKRMGSHQCGPIAQVWVEVAVKVYDGPPLFSSALMYATPDSGGT